MGRYYRTSTINQIQMIFFLKCQGGWRETQRLDVKTDSDDRLAEFERRQEEVLRLLRLLTPQEREIYRNLLQHARARSRGDEAVPIERAPLPPEIAHLEVREGDDGQAAPSARDDGVQASADLAAAPQLHPPKR